MGINDFKSFAQEAGLTYNAKKYLAFGKVQGYETIIKYATKQKLFMITMSVDGDSPEQEQMISQYLTSLSQKRPYVKCSSFDNNTITISVKFSIKNNDENLSEIINDVTSYCRTNGFVSCCKICGSKTNLGMFRINSQYAIMCDSCFEKAQVDLTMAQQANNEKKGNMIAGIVGALLASLIGVVLWVIVYQLGYIAGIVGMVMAICCMKGYEKFGGKLNVLGIIISLTIAIVMLYLAHNVAVALEIFNQFKMEYDITFFDAFQSIPSFLEDESFRRAFFADLGIGYFLMLIASVSTVIATYKKSNLKQKMIRLA